LPEQLLCSGPAASPRAASAREADSRPGQWIPHSRVLAVVRRAGECELGGVQAELLGCAAGDQRQRLQQLDRRARKDRPIDVAECEDDAAVGIEDRDRASVCRFGRAAAQGFDEDGVRHVRKPNARTSP
jgi:hypothetical protein